MPDIRLADQAIYYPWSIFPWWYHFDAYAPEVFDRAGALAGASGFFGCGAAVGGSLWRARQRGRVTTYGSARWATLREIRRAKLTGDAGVFLGRLDTIYLRHAGPEHVMAFAPSLVTAINSDVPGLVVAQLTDNAYDSITGRTLLIPQGARLIGTYESDTSYGQSRAQVVWRRIVWPNGASLRLDDLPATDAMGQSGLADRVDAHVGQLAKGVLLSTALGIGSELGFGRGESDLARALRESLQQNSARAGEQAVGKALDIKPSIKVRAGWPLRIIVHSDLVLEPWRP